MANYDIEDRRNDADYVQWHEDYEDYMQLKYENLQAQEELDEYLMLLRDENLNASVYISAESGYLQNPVIHRLLDNMTIYDSMQLLAQATLEGKDYLLEVDNEGRRIEESILEQSQEYDNVLVKVIAYEAETGRIVSEFTQESVPEQ